MSGSASPPLTSLTSCAPASRANSATRARMVSMETGSPPRGRPPAQLPPDPGQAGLADDPAQPERRPDQERLRLEGGQRDPGRVPGAREDEEPGLPDRAELGVELVQRLDLEPLGQEDEYRPPGLQ